MKNIPSDNPLPVDMELLHIGTIVRTRGLAGQVKVLPLTDLLEQFTGMEQVYLRLGDKLETRTISAVQFIRQIPYIKFAGIDSVEAAETLRGGEILIPRSQRIKLPRDAFYFDEISNFTVKSTEGEIIGALKDVEHLPASDLLIVERQGREILIPFVKQWVTKVDRKNRTIVIVHEPSLWDENNKPV